MRLLQPGLAVALPALERRPRRRPVERVEERVSREALLLFQRPRHVPAHVVDDAAEVEDRPADRVGGGHRMDAVGVMRISTLVWAASPFRMRRPIHSGTRSGYFRR